MQPYLQGVLDTRKVFPISALVILTEDPSSPYFGTIIEKVNLASITNFSYFSLCLFGLPFVGIPDTVLVKKSVV